ncbi:MAG: aminotransferase class I/II-fold pyridoxal phosphate-dependent enzyme, partial [Oscillospiraceae bacterium]|nr:aminotransferase class I/II-fold pyridoxal phosphate-dependent enzyme [Oscillospiraceae bacterium]
MSVERGIFEELKQSCPEMIPMHMPGHKRRTDLAPYLAALGAGLDITEINGFDNLHDPHGLLQSAMERACALWGSRRAFFLVNGSTCGILAAVKTCCAFGGKILLGRNAHRSVYNAVELFHLDPVYLAPEPSVTGIPGRISPENVARALEREPEIQTVVITSPTYEGVISDIASIARIVHGHGKTLIVDEAHGAHFGFGHGFPDSAVNLGADVVIHSLHKTLPSLTQTGIVHICSERVSPAALADALAVFETSSPSYLLMTSIDGCVSLLRQRGEELFSAWENALDGFFDRCRVLEKLRVPQGTDRDRSKILILTDRADLSGPELGERLRREHRIEPEMCLPDGVLAMTGMGD